MGVGLYIVAGKVEIADPSVRLRPQKPGAGRVVQQGFGIFYPQRVYSVHTDAAILNRRVQIGNDIIGKHNVGALVKALLHLSPYGGDDLGRSTIVGGQL